MKKSLFAVLFTFTFLGAVAQEDCFTRLQKAFAERGSYTVADDIHRKVIVCFFEGETTSCVNGKARVVDGRVSSIFLEYNDATYELMAQKFYNKEKTPPRIENGISEMIYTQDGQKLRVVFIEKLKPKKKEYQQAALPEDL